MTNRQLEIFVALILLLSAVLLGVGAAVLFEGLPPPIVTPKQRTTPRPQRVERGPARDPSGRSEREPDPSAPEAGASTQAPAHRTARELALRGAVQGQVRGRDTQAAVVDCRVVVSHATGERLGTARTSELGQYRIDGLPEDQALVVEFSAPSYLTGLCCDVRPTGGRALQVNAELITGPTVSVRVRTDDGHEPAAGVEVRLLDGIDVVHSARTDSAGTVILRAPFHGAYLVQAGGAGFALSVPVEVDLSRRHRRPEIQVDVLEGATLEATVMQPSRALAPGATVTLRSPFGEPTQVTADDRGRATFEHVTPGVDLWLRADAAAGYATETQLQVSDGQDTGRLLVLQPPGSVRGHLEGAARFAIAGAEIQIGPVRVRAHVTGEFTALEVPVGRHDIRVIEPRLTAQPVTVQVVSGQLLTQDIWTEPAEMRDLFGDVVDPAGDGVPGVTVELQPSRQRVTTGAHGDFQLRDVLLDELAVIQLHAPGSVVLPTGSGPRSEFLPRTAPVLLRYVLARGSPPPPKEVTRRLPRGSPSAGVGGFRASVRGRVLMPGGQPATGLEVVCRDDSTWTDSEGAFTLRDVAFVDGADAPRVVARPRGGLLLPTVWVVPHPAPGRVLADLGNVHLEQRPSALIDLRGTRDAEGAPLVRFWYASTRTDELLHQASPPLTAIECVSYDGTWLHVPDLGADGHQTLFFALDVGRGVLTTYEPWVVRTGAVDVLHPQTSRSAGELTVRLLSKGYVPSRLVLEQIGHGRATAFGAALTEALGATPATADPFATLMGRVGFSIDATKQRVRIEDMAPGTWRVQAIPQGTGQPVTSENVKLEEKARIDL